jgi:outer membrane protein insertion porin family
VRFGVPVTEFNAVNYGLAYERTHTGLLPDSAQRYVDFVNEFGEETDTILGSVGWARDKRDSVIYTTSGTFQRITAEAGLPGGDLTYYDQSSIGGVSLTREYAAFQRTNRLRGRIQRQAAAVL